MRVDFTEDGDVSAMESQEKTSPEVDYLKPGTQRPAGRPRSRSLAPETTAGRTGLESSEFGNLYESISSLGKGRSGEVQDAREGQATHRGLADMSSGSDDDFSFGDNEGFEAPQVVMTSLAASHAESGGAGEESEDDLMTGINMTNRFRLPKLRPPRGQIKKRKT